MDNMKFGPGNRPYWEMKEGRAQTRYPDLLRTLSKVRDPSQKRLLFESHRHKIRGTVGQSRGKIEQGGTRVSSQ